MTLWDMLTGITFLGPVVLIIQSYLRYKATGRLGILVVIPSLVFITVFYAVVIYMEHFSTPLEYIVGRQLFRLGLALLIVCLGISWGVDLYSIRRFPNGLDKH